MNTRIQQCVLTIAVLAYALFGFSPLLNMHGMQGASMGEYSMSMAMDSAESTHNHSAQNTAVVEGCSESSCVVPAANDCMKHCMEVAASKAIEQNIILPLSIAIAILAAIVVLFHFVLTQYTYRYREWFKPIYIFSTVQLLE